jgi:hypothetical protein
MSYIHDELNAFLKNWNKRSFARVGLNHVKHKACHSCRACNLGLTWIQLRIGVAYSLFFWLYVKYSG